jgi:NitT/TauT family transport system substrate-binding protein
LGTQTGESFAEGLYAHDAGFFERAGLNVELSFFNAGGAVTAAVVSGAIDVGVTNSGSMSAAHARGLPIYLLAPCTITSPGPGASTVIAVPKSSPLQTAKDLTGKTLCVSTVRDLQQAATMTWIDKNGGDSKSLTFVEIPISSQTAALLSGRIDAGVIIEPWITMSKNDLRIIAQPYQSIAPHILISGWITNKAWYEGNVATARAFVRALRTTAAWANKNHAATAVILEKYSKIPREVIATMNRLEIGENLDPKLIQPVIDATVRYGFLPKAFTAADLFAPNLS